MLESALPVAFIPATDLGRARDFYEGALGLPAQDVSSFACVFRVGPITLRVTLVGELVLAREGFPGFVGPNLMEFHGGKTRASSFEMETSPAADRPYQSVPVKQRGRKRARANLGPWFPMFPPQRPREENRF